MDASPLSSPALTVWAPRCPSARGTPSPTACLAAMMLAAVEGVLPPAIPPLTATLFVPLACAPLLGRALRSVEAAASTPALLARLRATLPATQASPSPAALADAVAEHRSELAAALARVAVVHVASAAAVGVHLARLGAAPPAWFGIACLDTLLPGLRSCGGAAASDVAAFSRLLALATHTAAWAGHAARCSAARGCTAPAHPAPLHVGFQHADVLAVGGHPSPEAHGAALLLPPSPLATALHHAAATVSLYPT